MCRDCDFKVDLISAFWRSPFTLWQIYTITSPTPPELMSWRIFQIAAQALRRNQNLELQLAEAITNNQLLLVKQLLCQGANPNIRLPSFDQEPLIFLCFAKKHFKLPTAKCNTPHQAYYNLDPKLHCLRILLEHGADPNLVNNRGQTVLDLAIIWCLPEVVKLLLLHQVNPNCRDAKGLTPLMKASMWGIEDARPMIHKLEIIWHLLNGGAKIDAQASDGKTALMFAVGHSRILIAEFLVQSGASLKIRDHQGNQAQDIISRHIDRPRRKYLRRILRTPPINPTKYQYPQLIPEGDLLLAPIIKG